MSKKDIENLLEIAQSIHLGAYNMIVVVLFTGMRRGEIMDLLWSEIDFNHSRIVLSRTKTKNNKGRVIPIVPSFKNFLLSLRNQAPHSAKVFEKMSRTIFQKNWEKIREMVPFGVITDGTKLRFHDLRHVYAQQLLDNGVQLEDIQVLLGHTDFSTTQRRYAMFARPDLHKEAKKIEKVVRIEQKII